MGFLELRRHCGVSHEVRWGTQGPGISAPEVGLAPALLRLEGGAHSRGRPPWVAALSTPAGSPLSETLPFMGIFRLQDRPS